MQNGENRDCWWIKQYTLKMRSATYADADFMVDVALEVIDALVATKKHRILLLSRKVQSSWF